MRQVPIHYLVIGTGRMALHFCYYLSLLKLSFQQISARAHPDQVQSAITQATHIVVLLKDSVIDSFLADLPSLTGKTVIHFSGCHTSSLAYSAHPLMTFSDTLYDEACYGTIPFILEEEGPPMAFLLPGIPNTAYYIKAESKAFYHALCVMGGNFTCLLWQKIFHEFKEKWHLPQAVVIPYLKQIAINLQEKPDAALTGPLIRKDSRTISANLQALQNDKFHEIYHAFVKVFAPELL